MQKSCKVVDIIRSIFARGVELLGQGEEWTGVLVEIVYVKDGLWVGDVVLLKVVI